MKLQEDQSLDILVNKQFKSKTGVAAALTLKLLGNFSRFKNTFAEDIMYGKVSVLDF